MALRPACSLSKSRRVGLERYTANRTKRSELMTAQAQQTVAQMTRYALILCVPKYANTSMFMLPAQGALDMELRNAIRRKL